MRAAEFESTELRERAVTFESIEPPKRAVVMNSTELEKRAGRPEYAVYRERAVPRQSTEGRE